MDGFKPDPKPGPKVKYYKCRSCRADFIKDFPNDVCCSYQCKVAYATKKANQARDIRKAKDRKRIQAEKIKMKTLSDWHKDLQSVVNRIVRELDKGLPCIIKGRQFNRMDASHYYSRGACPHLRYCVWNIHMGNTHSNRYRGGEVLQMADGIIDRYGQKVLDHLASHKGKYEGMKWTIEQIRHDLLPKCRKILKRLKDGEVMTRDQVEIEIGLYEPIKI